MKFNLARDAIKFLIKKYSIKEIYIPYYLCDVVRHAIFEVGAKPLYYHIDDNFMPEVELKKDAYILYPNYFGICDKNVEILAKKYPNLIVDNAHAYYATSRGFATIYAKHKFFPVEFGAELCLEKDKKNTPADYSRRKKYEDYAKIFANRNLLKIEIENDCIPFCYPFLAPTIEEADEVAKELQQKGLIIYRYWNPIPKSFNEYKFYSRLVPIPLS